VIDPARLRGLYARLMPDRVTVTYRAQTALGVYQSPGASVADAWWRPGGTTELAPSAGVALLSLRKWYFPKSAYTGPPAVGDLIVNPVTAIDPVSVTWTVVGGNDAGALGTWELDCLSLQLQAALRGSLTFERPSNAQDAAGRMALSSYSAVASGVPARVQPEDGAAGEVLGRVTIARRFTALLGVRVAVRARDRAYDGTTYYTVVSSEMPERLDELQRVELEQIL